MKNHYRLVTITKGPLYETKDLVQSVDITKTSDLYIIFLLDSLP